MLTKGNGGKMYSVTAFMTEAPGPPPPPPKKKGDEFQLSI